MPRHLVQRLAAGLVAVVGVAVLVVAAVLAGQGSQRETVVGSASAPKAPVLVTAPGVLELIEGGVRIQAAAGRPQGTVFIGIARAADVQAYLDKVARVEVTGLDTDRRLTTRTQGSEPTVPDPAVADIWVLSSTGAGSTELGWTEQPGRWQAVVATDGTAPAPASFRLTWDREKAATAAVPALVGVGVLLLVGGLVALAVLRLRRPRRTDRAVRGRRAARYPYQDDPVPAAGPAGDPDGSDHRPLPPARLPVAEPQQPDLFAPNLQPNEHAGLVDRRTATPGLAPDRPTARLRRVPPEPEVEPEDLPQERPDHPTTVLRRVRVDRPWNPDAERPGREG